MPSRRRVGKDKAVQAAVAQNKALLAQRQPTPSGEPHRIMPKSVSAVLEDIMALSDDDLGLLFWSISEGMWEEWDCSLAQGIEMFGEVEMRVAIKSAVYAAKAIEQGAKQ